MKHGPYPKLFFYIFTLFINSLLPYMQDKGTIQFNC